MKLNAVPIRIAAAGRIALPWLTATVAVAALVLGVVSYNAASSATSAADNIPFQRPVVTSTVVPGVFPVQDHVVSWDAHVPAHDQMVMMFGSLKAAVAAGAVAKSSAWTPTEDQRQPVLIAWEACKNDGHDNFFVSKKWGGLITASDCTMWWAGEDTKLEAFRGW